MPPNLSQYLDDSLLSDVSNEWQRVLEWLDEEVKEWEEQISEVQVEYPVLRERGIWASGPYNGDQESVIMNWREHITVDPSICHGRACFRGTRIFVSVVLDNLAAGEDPDSVLRSYPSLDISAINAAIAYAAELARERVVALPA